MPAPQLKSHRETDSFRATTQGRAVWHKGVMKSEALTNPRLLLRTPCPYEVTYSDKGSLTLNISPASACGVPHLLGRSVNS